MRSCSPTLKVQSIIFPDQSVSFVNLQNGSVVKVSAPFAVELIAQLDPQDAFRLGYFLHEQQVNMENKMMAEQRKMQ